MRSLHLPVLRKCRYVTFTQAGWLQGGLVTGSFEGEDLDADGIISQTEVTDFSLSWSGNSTVPAFNFTDVDTWEFSTSLGQLISGFTSQATSFWSYDGRIGSVGIGGFAGTISDTTQLAPVFTPSNTQSVPEPDLVVASLIALLAIPSSKRFLVEKHR
ncbi:hypothetical protein JYQ62_22780 [Nostoc sp. UHCC 0702]|nr:hypothetical protein JYQ62_22780 [Nostoc sp. UHCC 0702]